MCSQLSTAQCESVRGEVVRFIGPDRQEMFIVISTNSICLGDPFHPIPCPLATDYFASGVAELGDGEWAFVNVLAAADGQLRSDGRILTAPADWTPYVVGAEGTPSLAPSPSPDQIGLGVVNGTDLQVSLVVNGAVIETLAPGEADTAIPISALPPLPWIVEARTPSGRALATMTVDPGIGSTQLPTKEAGVDLSCGQLYLWTTAQEPIWPAPDSGSPGDCLP